MVLKIVKLKMFQIAMISVLQLSQTELKCTLKMMISEN